MAIEKPEVVNFKFAVDSQTAISQATKFQKELTKKLKVVERNEKDLNKGLTQYLYRMGRVKQVVGPVLQKELKSRKAIRDVIASTNLSFAEVVKTANQTLAVVTELKTRQTNAEKELKSLREDDYALGQKQLANQKRGLRVDEAAIAASKSKVAAAEANVESVMEMVRAQEVALKGAESILSVKKQELATLRELEASGESMAEPHQDLEKSVNIQGLTDALKASGEDLSEPFRAFASKDLPGIFVGLGRVFGKTVSKLDLIGKMHTAAKKEEATGGDPAMKGVIGVIGKLASSIAPVLKGISTMLPMLGMIGGVIMGIVKFLLGAEAAMKDFQKEILSTSGSADFLAGSMGNVGLGAAAAEKAMGVAYDEASRLVNVQRGITKEMTSSFQSQLGAEGVTLSMLNDQIAKVPKEVSKLSGGLSGLNDVMWTSVAYSRHWGVSLSELTQLQGELTSEVGMSLTSLTVEYERLTQGAAEAGMASNKFFGIIKSFSTDLSLFALRMVDVTTALTAMGKVMNPRDSAKFLRTLTDFGKGDVLDNLKTVMLAGEGKARGIAQKGLSSRVESTVSDLGAKVDPASMLALKDAISKGDTKGMSGLLATLGDKITSDQRGALERLTINQGRLNTKNSIDLAMVIKDQGPGENMALLEALAQKNFGTPLAKLSGTQIIAFKGMTGQSEDMITQMALMSGSLEITRETLAKKLEKGLSLTVKETAQLKKLSGLTGKAATAANVRGADDQDIYNSFTQGQQDLLKDSANTKKFQDATAHLTVSTLDEFSILVENLLTKIFTSLKKIADSPMFGGKSDADVKGEKIQAGLEKSKNTELMSAWKASGEDAAKYQKDALSKVVLPALADKMSASSEDDKAAIVAALEDAVADSSTNRTIAGHGFTNTKKQSTADIEASEAKLGRKLTADEMATKLAYYLDQTDYVAVMERLTKATEEAADGAAAPKAAPTAPKAAPTTSVWSDMASGVADFFGGDAPKEAPKASPAASPAVAALATVPATPADVEATTAAVGGVTDTLKRGIPIEKSTVDKMGGATLEAIRTGLFEYYMYKDLDQKVVAQGLRGGAFSPGSFGSGVVGGATTMGSPQAALGKMLSPNADGGLVTSIANGIANVRSAPGEGLASVGTGERITPAGGRGGGGNLKVELELKGDLRRFIDARVVEGAAEHDRNKRLR